MLAHGMLPEDGKILVACSGGADSVALLRLLRELPGLTVTCAHYNHCLRGAESDRDEAFVRALCEKLCVPFYAGRGDVASYARDHGLGVEEAARVLRYAFLRETAASIAISRIATAHTADDQAETVLFHLLRGAGAAGLSGIQPVRADGVIRPLLAVRRAELAEYLTAIAQDHVEDSTNADEAYSRNYLRRQVFPLLTAVNSAAVEHVCAAAERLRADEEYLNGLAGDFIQVHRGEDGGLPVSRLSALPDCVALRVLRRLCSGADHAQLARVLSLCRSENRRAALALPGLTVHREGDRLLFGPELTPAPLPRRALIPGGTLVLSETGQALRWTDGTICPKIYNSFNNFFFQSEKLYGIINVATRMSGDRIRLAGRGCTKEIRRLYSEAGLSAAERVRRLVLSDERGPIAVQGFGAAERCAARPGETALRVEILDCPPPETAD